MSGGNAYAALVQANVARAETERAAGRAVFRMDLIDSWPACVDCEHAIRRNLDPADHELPDGVRNVGHFRGCGCPGRIWRSEGPRGRERTGSEWVIIVPGAGYARRP